MKWSGWLFMLVSWSVILGLFFYCMVRTLRSGRNDDDVPAAVPGQTSPPDDMPADGGS